MVTIGMSRITRSVQIISTESLDSWSPEERTETCGSTSMSRLPTRFHWVYMSAAWRPAKTSPLATVIAKKLRCFS